MAQSKGNKVSMSGNQNLPILVTYFGAVTKFMRSNRRSEGEQKSVKTAPVRDSILSSAATAARWGCAATHQT